MNKRILWIDAFNLFYRSMATFPGALPDSKPVGATAGFIFSLKSWVEKFKPSQVIIVFDGPNAGYRRRMIFKNYKGRHPRKDRFVFLEHETKKDFKLPSNEDEQLLLIYQFLSHLPVYVLQIDDTEADDVISCGILRDNEKKFDHIICSSDSDYFQLLDTNVVQWYPPTKTLYSFLEIKERFNGLLAENYTYYKIILGDNSDKISGVKGVGEKTLFKLIPEFKEIKINDLNHLIEIIDSKKDKSKVLEKIKSSKEQIILNYRLINLTSNNLSLTALKAYENQLNLQHNILLNEFNLIRWAKNSFMSFIIGSKINEICNSFRFVKKEKFE